MDDDASIISPPDSLGGGGDMMAAAAANNNAAPPSWSPSRYTRQRRERRRANKLRQHLQEQEQAEELGNEKPKSKTLGLVNRKVLGLELVASPALLARHSEWNFADFDSNEAVMQASNAAATSVDSDENECPNNDNNVARSVSGGSQLESERKVDDEEVVPRSSSSRSGGSWSEAKSNHGVSIFGSDSDNLRQNNTSSVNGRSLRKKLTLASLRRLGASTRSKKTNVGNSFERSDSLDEPFSVNNDGQDDNSFNNIVINEVEQSSDAMTPLVSSNNSSTDVDQTFPPNPNSMPSSSTAAGPSSPMSLLIRERSIRGVLDGRAAPSDVDDTTNKSDNNLMLPLHTPMTYASMGQKNYDAESTTDTKNQENGMELGDSTPPPTPPKLTGDTAGNPLEESPTGVQELTLYRFVQRRFFPRNAETNVRENAMEEDGTNDDVEQLDKDENGGESSSVAASEDVREVGEEMTRLQLLESPKPLFSPTVWDDNEFENDVNDVVAKPVDVQVQEPLDDHISVIDTSVSVYLENLDAIVGSTSSGNMEGGLKEFDDVGTKEGRTAVVVSGVMKKLISSRKRLVHNHGADTHPTAPTSDDTNDMGAKSVDLQVQDPLDDRISVIDPTLSNYLEEKDAIVDNINIESGLRVTDEVSTRDGSASTSGMSGVMKKLVSRRKRLVQNHDASTHPTVGSTSESDKLRNDQEEHDQEDDASYFTSPTEGTMSNDVLSDDLLTGEEELTLLQYLQHQVDGGVDNNIIDNQNGGSEFDNGTGREEGAIDDEVVKRSNSQACSVAMSKRSNNSLLSTLRPRSFTPRGRSRSQDISEEHQTFKLSDIDDALADTDVNEERSSDNCGTIESEVIRPSNIEYSSNPDDREEKFENEVTSARNSSDRHENTNNSDLKVSDDQSELEGERSEIENETKKKKEKENGKDVGSTSWFDTALDKAVNDVVGAVDEDFVEDMLGIANQAAVVVLKSVRNAIHNIDDVLSGCLEEDEDDEESNKAENDEEFEDDEEEVEEDEDDDDDDDDDGVGLLFRAAHNYDEKTGKMWHDSARNEKTPMPRSPKKTKMTSLVKLRRVVSGVGAKR